MLPEGINWIDSFVIKDIDPLNFDIASEDITVRPEKGYCRHLYLIDENSDMELHKVKACKDCGEYIAGRCKETK